MNSRLLPYYNAMMHPEESLKSLREIHLTGDGSGRIKFYTTDRYIAFETTHVDRGESTLSIPLDRSPSLSARLSDRSLATHDNPLTARSQFLPAELRITTSIGATVDCDVVVQCTRRTVEQIIALNPFDTSRTLIRVLIGKARQIVEQSKPRFDQSYVINPATLCFDANNTPLLFDYPFLGQSAANDIATQAVFTAVALYLRGCNMCRTSGVDTFALYRALCNPTTRRQILYAAQCHRHSVVESIAAENRFDTDRAIDAIYRLECSDFSELTAVARVVRDSIDHPVVMFESNSCYTDNRKERIDLDSCKHGIPSEGFVAYTTGRLWGYATTQGERIVDQQFDRAEEFRASRAVVEHNGHYALIDPAGNFAMLPRYDDLVWWDRYGVVTALADGEWHIYNGDGRRLTADGYDYLGDCREGVFVASRGNRYGYVDLDGRPLTPLCFNRAFPMCHGRAEAQLHYRTVTVNIDGEIESAATRR